MELRFDYAEQLDDLKRSLLKSCEWQFILTGKATPFKTFSLVRHTQLLLEDGQSMLEDDEDSDVEMTDVGLTDDGSTEEYMPIGPGTPNT